MSAHYDDPDYSYEKYWENRSYEHASELIAIKKLLSHPTKYQSIADIGGGFGRLSSYLSSISKHVNLVEPSKKLRVLASKYLSHLPNVSIIGGSAQCTNLPDSSQDVVFMVRVIHHIRELTPVFNEVKRICKPHGLFLLEFANSLHFKSRVKSFLTGVPILLTPLERRSSSNIKKNTIDFVNHHPHTILKHLRQSNFEVISVYSVSNFRYPFLKKIIPERVLLNLESLSQKSLAKIFFGPSIFILAQKR